MIQFGNLRLNNIVYFKEAELDLDYRGITVIRGHNGNVKVKRSNGVGKSLFTSAIPKLRYGSSPTTVRNKRGASKNMHSNGSSISLQVKSDADYSIEQRMKGNSIKYTILKDGIDIKARTPTISKEEIEKIIPINEDEYFSFVHLHVKRRFVLHQGTPAERYAFFSSIFHLDEFDEAAEYFSTKIREGKDDRIRYDMVKGEVERIKQEPTVNVAKSKARIRKYRKLILKLEKKAHNQQKQFAALTSAKKVTELRKEISKMSAQLSLSSVSPELLKGLLRIADQKIDSLRAYERYKEELSECETRRNELISRLNNLPKKLRKWKSSKLRKIHDRTLKVSSTVSELKSRISELRDDLDSSKEARSKLSDLNEKLGKNAKLSSSDVSKKLGKAEAQIEQVESSISDLEDVKGKCMVCGSSISSSKKKSILKHRHAQLKGLRDEIQNQRKVLSLLRRRQEIQMGDVETIKVKLTNSKKALRKLLKTIKYDTNLLSKAIRIRSSLDQLHTPKKVAKISGVKLSDLRKEKEVLSGLLERVKIVGTRDSIEWSEKAQASLQSSMSKVTNKLKTFNSKLTELRFEVKRTEETLEKLNKFEGTLKKLHKEVRNLPYYEALKEGYSTKGLKMLYIKNLTSRIESNLNAYAPLLFPERFTFSFDVDVNKFGIQVHRHEKDKTISSDVSDLSGAETQCFILLCLMSILPLIPASRRTNILILDEMSSNMDASSNELFRNSFLPMMSKIIPHIIVVTPDDNEYSNARNLYVYKKGSESRLLTTQQMQKELSKRSGK